jgi:hypothetical protein
MRVPARSRALATHVRGYIVATAGSSFPSDASANRDDLNVLDAAGRIWRRCRRLRALWAVWPVVVRVHSSAWTCLELDWFAPARRDARVAGSPRAVLDCFSEALSRI